MKDILKFKIKFFCETYSLRVYDSAKRHENLCALRIHRASLESGREPAFLARQ